MDKQDFARETQRNARPESGNGTISFDGNKSGGSGFGFSSLDGELNPGTVIDDRYILKEYKGRGSFGEVWLAYDNELEIDVAIKLYISLDQKGQDEFKSEYKVAFGLNHQNLLTAQHYSVWNHRPYLIMKYCSNGSANDQTGNITNERDIWRFIHDVAAGLKFLHGLETPIVHQDIKPENILIDDQGTYLITDFGISRKMRSTLRKQSKRAAESGAIAYMGPERFLKDPIAVKASDIWSLGVSIYEMATGELPFCGQGGGMLNAGAEIPDLDTTKWSKNLNEVMRACLAKETWERPTAEKLEDYSKLVLDGNAPEWSKWVKGEVVKPGGEKKSHKSLIIGIIGGVVLAGAIVAAIIIGGNDSANRDAAKARYGAIMSRAANNLKVGNAVNYMALLTAREQLDSLDGMASVNPFLAEIPEFNIDAMKSDLNAKIDEAYTKWFDSANGTLSIVEDPAGAISEFHIAAMLKSDPAVKNALETVGTVANCSAAPMITRRAYVDNGTLVVEYDGLTDSNIPDVTVQYELSDGDEIWETGLTTFTLESGNGNSIAVALNNAGRQATGVRLSQNDITLFDTMQ
ncbi:MAG: serine/threonine-protein kinase [Muribaculaceae bacterium]